MNATTVKFKRDFILPIKDYFHNREIIKTQWYKIEEEMEYGFYKKHKNSCEVELNFYPDYDSDSRIPVSPLTYEKLFSILEQKIKRAGFTCESEYEYEMHNSYKGTKITMTFEIGVK